MILTCKNNKKIILNNINFQVLSQHQTPPTPNLHIKEEEEVNTDILVACCHVRASRFGGKARFFFF